MALIHTAAGEPEMLTVAALRSIHI